MEWKQIVLKILDYKILNTASTVKEPPPSVLKDLLAQILAKEI